jgi:hypothetical protein
MATDYDFQRPTNVEMAGDYTDSKPGLGKVYKENAVTSDWIDEEPLITPKKLREVHLWGIPLVSNIRDPFTKKPAVMDDVLLKQHIIEAVALGEAESKTEIFPRQYVESQAFDRAAYDSFGYMQLRHRPVLSLESMTVTPSNEMPVFQIPLDWISTQLLHLGQIALIPLTIATKGGSVVPLTSSPGGATFLSIFGNKPWIPMFFEVRYTAGFKDAVLPKIINQYVGCIAAMEVLSLLATTYSRSNSTSLSLDGMSQSIGTPGMEIYKQRMQELSDKRKWILGRVKAAANMSFIVDNV